MDATIMTRRGQISVPAEIRKRHNLQGGQRFVWLDEGVMFKLIPVPADPVSALRGRGKGENLLAKLLEERHKERESDG
jgi:bifunctional DNA-binding transcriptional regulator/antitoxin component of YhaV-PrlF toxin-antitoxin module